MEVFRREAFLDEGFHHTAEATLGELHVVIVAAWRAGLGQEGKFLAAHALGEGFQPVGFGTADKGAVVVELHEVRRLHGCGDGRFGSLAVLQAMLEVGVLLLSLSACVLCLVCQFLGFGGFALQDVQAVASVAISPS